MGRSDLMEPATGAGAPGAMLSGWVVAGDRLTSRADRYWLAIVHWERGELDPALLSAIVAVLRRQRREHTAIRCDSKAVGVLLAQEPADGDESQAQPLVEQVIELVRARWPASSPCGMLAEASVPVAELAAETRRLLSLRRYAGQRPLSAQHKVVSDRCLALVQLLEGVDRRRTIDFIARHIGPLLDYDRVHRTDLAGLLEVALDIPSRDGAAHAAYMHRNTFRRHLHHAQELVGLDLDDGDQCLTVHVALKLARAFDVELTPSVIAT